jgi:methionyl-tRNA synthetase
VNLVRAAALAAWPFIPTAAERVLENVGEASDVVSWPNDGEAALAAIPGGRRIAVPPPLFRKITVADVPHP